MVLKKHLPLSLELSQWWWLLGHPLQTVQRLLSSWWSGCSLKCCCRPAFATQRYGTCFLGDINTSATRNHKKLLWFAVSFQGLNSIQTFVSGLRIFSGNLGKILQKSSYLTVCNKKLKTIKIKNRNTNPKQIPKNWIYKRWKKPWCLQTNFCLQFLCAIHILTQHKEIETSKVMFVGRNHMFFLSSWSSWKRLGAFKLFTRSEMKTADFKAPKLLSDVWSGLTLSELQHES